MPDKQETIRMLKEEAETLVDTGNLTQARNLYCHICNNDKSDIAAWVSLAIINRKLGLNKDAGYCARHALSIQPANHIALAEYGAYLHHCGRPDEAINFYRKSIVNNRDYGEAHYFLGTAFLEKALSRQAIEEYKETLKLEPEHLQALNNLSAIYTNHGMIQESLELLERALEIYPNEHHLLENLARTCTYTGDSCKALNILEMISSKHPEITEAYSKYLMCINYVSQQSPGAIFRKHKRWADIHTRDIHRYGSYNCTCEPDKILRVGYVSGDFRMHSVSHFIEPIIRAHDRNRFHISCYSDVRNPDEITHRLESMCDAWICTNRMTGEDLSQKIHADRIDILVDLAGHTASNRLIVFAHKPAPVQVSYLGYPNTTGLCEIDYRLTDPIADPPGKTDGFYSERLTRLPDGFLCYQPPDNAPETTGIHDQEHNGITFGSFNNLAKVTTQTIRTWSCLLESVPSSRLLLKSRATNDPYTRSRLLQLFSKQGIKEERLDFPGFKKSIREHLATYNTVDIALDTFPYNGTTTTCEALWMGVPVITLAGHTHASRVGASILGHLDLEFLVAGSEDQYIDIAVNLSRNKEKRTYLRSHLRGMMQSSRLCDAESFVRKLETAYRNMWDTYCSGAP